MENREWIDNLNPREKEALKEMGCTEFEIERIISKDEVFKRLLEYEGIIGYEYWIKSKISRIYSIEL